MPKLVWPRELFYIHHDFSDDPLENELTINVEDNDRKSITLAVKLLLSRVLSER